MNGIFYFLPFLLIASIGLSQTTYAVEETIVGINYFDVTNPDGTHTWSTHHEYILDDGVYVPYIQNGLTVESKIDDVTLNPDGSYSWDGKFTDKIIGKYADISDLTSWTYPNGLNNDVPDVSFSNNEFHSNKVRSGVADMDYKYVFNNGQWKTELVVTNLSGLTTKVFGFDQVIDLNSDTIKFDGIIRNLDNFDGVTFDKTFLDNNEGKVLDLLVGVNFDFDLGYENLYSITVHDTGVNSSQLVFDYRTTEILLPNDTLIIDPTYLNTPNTSGRVYSASATGSVCLAGAGGTTGTTLYKSASGVNNVCNFPWFDFDISGIDSSYTVTSAFLEVDSSDNNSEGTANEHGVLSHLPTQATSSAGTYDELISLDKISADDSVTLDGGATNEQITFNANGISKLQSAVTSAQGWYSLGATTTSLVRVSNGLGNIVFSNIELSITYKLIPSPDSITDLTLDSVNSTAAIVSFTPPNLNTGNLTTYTFNLDTPQNDNVQTFFGNSTDNPFTFTGLTWGTSYSANATAITEGGANYTLANVLNFTTDTPLYTGVAPTDLTVDDCYHTCTTQLNLEWAADLMDNINGFRIFFETPIGNGFTTLTANTTTTTTYYNATGLTPGVFYNYKVAAMNGTGISENSTAYAQTPHKLPNSVTDLTITPNSLLQFLGVWTAPDLFGTLNGYQINYTTPAGDPQTIYTSTNPGVTATISGLNPTVEYSFRVSANTYHGINATGGNIANATASSEIAVGDLDFDAGDNPDVEPIWFENYIVDTTTNDVQVRFASALTVDCTITERVSNTNTTYTGLSETAATGYVYHNFTVTNAGNDILDWDCYDQTDALINGQYALTQDQAASGVGGFGNVPMFSLMGNFTGGLYGTEGEFAGIDLITLFIVIISMLGFNKKNPALGVGVMATLLGAAWYYGLIPWTSGVLGALAVVLVLAIGQGIKRD